MGRVTRAFTTPFRAGRGWLTLALLAATGPLAQGNSPDNAVQRAFDRVFRMDYPAAENILGELPAGEPARAYYAGAVCLNRFLDWGDTAALTRAERHWESLSPRGSANQAFRVADPAPLRLYRGLAGFQLSYTAALRGQRLRSATLALAARRQLQGLDRAEARAALLLYDHYRSRLIGKLPLVDSDPFPEAAFRREADASPAALRDLLLFSLFWIQVDEGRIEPALRLADGFLARYPDNRAVREMRGSALFHAGRHAEARSEYESLRREYSALPKGGRVPLGYFRSVGNLARIADAQGRKAEARELVAEWNRAGLSGAAAWLPASLRDDLARL